MSRATTDAKKRGWTEAASGFWAWGAWRVQRGRRRWSWWYVVRGFPQVPFSGRRGTATSMSNAMHICESLENGTATVNVEGEADHG